MGYLLLKKKRIFPLVPIYSPVIELTDNGQKRPASVYLLAFLTKSYYDKGGHNAAILKIP